MLGMVCGGGMGLLGGPGRPDTLSKTRPTAGRVNSPSLAAKGNSKISPGKTYCR